uniref:Sleeping Beauty transposase HTH domain-containing protein n=1 Tax=Poecilia latipinna TaxID=48699 RepID=A0A3B3VXN1_9TELE
MPRSNQLSEAVRRRIIDLHSSGNGYKRISKELSVHRSTIRKIIYKWRKFRTVSTLPRSGRPRKNAPEGRCAAQKEVEKEPPLSTVYEGYGHTAA